MENEKSLIEWVFMFFFELLLDTFFQKTWFFVLQKSSDRAPFWPEMGPKSAPKPLGRKFDSYNHVSYIKSIWPNVIRLPAAGGENFAVYEP